LLPIGVINTDGSTRIHVICADSDLDISLDMCRFIYALVQISYDISL